MYHASHYSCFSSLLRFSLSLSLACCPTPSSQELAAAAGRKLGKTSEPTRRTQFPHRVPSPLWERSGSFLDGCFSFKRKRNTAVPYVHKNTCTNQRPHTKKKQKKNGPVPHVSRHHQRNQPARTLSPPRPMHAVLSIL